MKRVSLTFAVAASCGAFLLGAFVFRVEPDKGSKSAEAIRERHLPVEPLDASKRESKNAESDKALGDLRVTQAQLEEELAATKLKLKQAETAMARYESVHEKLVEQGDLSIRFPGSRFAIPETLHEFLKLDEAVRQQMHEAVEGVFADIRDWEAASAELSEQADGRIFSLSNSAI